MNFTWQPGIGDPSLGGWLTVLLYFAATGMAFRVTRCLGGGCRVAASEGRVWFLLAAGFLLLGINKQLDLQSVVTDIGRVAAAWGGWYEQRRVVQLIFVGFVLAVAAGALVLLANAARSSPVSTWIALAGSVFVAAYVIMRAASFHHVDAWIGSTFLGLRWNWILEMGGIAIVLLGAVLRLRAAHVR
jgi:hypothetical protein